LANDFGFVVFPQWAIPARLGGALLSVDNFIDITVPLPANEADIVSTLPDSARADLRRIRNHGLRVEISRDAAWAHEFYHRFHHPSVTGRHGDDAFTSTPEEMRRILAEPGAEWIKIYRNDVCVSALIASFARDGYMLHRLGWRDGSSEWLKAGAVSALYWFCIQRAIQLKCPRLHLGGVPPFLNDTLLVYKSKWGARIDPCARRFTNRSILINPEHPGFRRFLETQTLIARAPTGNFMVLSTHLPDAVPTATAQAPFIASWFRLRESPLPDPNPVNTVLPVPLQPWFDAIPLPARVNLPQFIDPERLQAPPSKAR
jgi:hypothetical protein